jgi:hypothetical protein
MTIEDQIGAIQALGYSQPEAQFLRLVALHSGYFVRRQLLRSLGCTRGKRSKDFLDELTGRGHACRELFRQDRHIFRLQSRTIYEALGHEDNRNRREHQPSTVRLRLMALDFALEHGEYQYLVTQQDRLSYFFEQRRIDAEALPARVFNSNGTLTTRYFPDGFPQFLHPDNPFAISFIYIDDAQLTPNAFRAYLRNYRNLFERLGTLDLAFVTTAAERLAIAQNTLAHFCARAWESAAPAVDLNRLLAHFPHRLLYEKRSTAALNTAQMNTLQEDLHMLCSPQIENLYAIWKQDGVEGLRAELAAQETPAPPQIHLTTSVLEYDYDLFGTLHAAS